MMKLKHARKGQMVTSEYVLLFFVVISGVSAMTVFVQRALQSRDRDTKKYMIDLAGQACIQATQGNVDCMGAAGINTAQSNQLAYEYEPYYGHSTSKVQNDSGDKKSLTPNRWERDYATATIVNAASHQSPPAKEKREPHVFTGS